MESEAKIPKGKSFANLEVSHPNDYYEREADAVAGKVMRSAFNMEETFSHPVGNGMSIIQRSGGSPFIVMPEMESRLTNSRGGGNALPPALRSRMEGSFGFDFNATRLHTDARAVQMSREINAKAFTHGNDIYFNSGQYQPENTSGQHLLAHELAHVVQQTGKVQRQTDNVSEKGKRKTYPPSEPSYKWTSQKKFSTPIPKEFSKNTQKQYEGIIMNEKNIKVKVIILQDKFVKEFSQANSESKGKEGAVWPDYKRSVPQCTYVRDKGIDIIQSCTPIEVTIFIHTEYLQKADLERLPAYGRGKTLKEHEGSHGTDHLNFLLNLNEYPMPIFQGSEGMAKSEFEQKIKEFDEAMNSYLKMIGEVSIRETDKFGSEENKEDVSEQNMQRPVTKDVKLPPKEPVKIDMQEMK